MEFDNTNKYLKMMNVGTTQLDKVLTVGKLTGDNHGIDFIDKGVSNSKTIFVMSTAPNNPSATKNKSFITSSLDKTSKSINFIFICHFCNVRGHI